MKASKETIFALATQRGKSGIAVFRVSGKDSHTKIKSISSKKKFKTNFATINDLLDGKSVVDQTLTTFFKSPKSYTGEDMVEISCHGSISVINKITKTLLKKQIRLAEPGEFTKRALMNDKLSVLEAETINDLVNAETENQRKMAVGNLSGNLDKLVNEYVKNGSEVTTRIMTPKAAIEKGALAFFGEKYGEEVRVVSMGKEKDAYFSTELCGGTHVKNTGDIGKFKTVSQSSIAAGVRRVEALRDKQLEDFIKNKEKLSTLSVQKDEETIKDLSSQIIKLGGKPKVDNKDLKEIIKNLSKQLEQLNVNSVLQDKTKNIINDQKIKDIKVRFQKVQDLPPKDLRKLVDSGKKELGDGIVIVFASSEDKVGLGVGVTEKLVDKYDAVKFAKLGSEIIGGKGGGGRKDFAQAGGQDKNKIDEAFEKLKALI